MVPLDRHARLTLDPARAGELPALDANAVIPPTNDRMPVLLDPDEYDRWLNGDISDVIGFQFRKPFALERMEVLRTNAMAEREAS